MIPRSRFSAHLPEILRDNINREDVRAILKETPEFSLEPDSMGPQATE